MPTPPDAATAARPADALAHLQAGRPGATEALARQALALAPTDATWQTLLALALSAQQRPAEALGAYEALVAAQPGVATHWANLGNCLCELGREREALAPLQRAQALGADDPGVHFALARVHAALGPARTGLAHIDRALRHAPGEPEFRLLRARLLTAVDEWELANQEIDALLAQPLQVAQRVELGYLLLRGGLYADALHLFEAAVRAAPGDVDAQLGAIMTLERINRVEDAGARREALEAQLDAPARERVRDKLLQVDARLAARAGEHARAAADLRALLDMPLPDPALRISLGFDLGVALDKCGERDAAMAAFARAHAERRQQVDADHPALTSRDGLYGVLDQPPLRPRRFALPDDGRQDPVFVVGFPRSGTTLLEQLLDAHSALASFDEQPFVQRLVRRLVGTQSALEVQAALDALDDAGAARLRARYFADVDHVVPDLGARRPVDKNPLNLVRLPAVQPFMPRAHVILALRHPCDVVLSCYMQNFRAPAFAVTFETLERCAEMYDRVFAHWWAARDGFAPPVHVLRYEDLVADTEGEARRLFAFLGLPWEDSLLAFTERAKRKGRISTPSYTQVIERVNARAVGRWEAYRGHFSDAALAHLAPWAERFGYGPL